jgi:hypothetical protein
MIVVNAKPNSRLDMVIVSVTNILQKDQTGNESPVGLPKSK